MSKRPPLAAPPLTKSALLVALAIAGVTSARAEWIRLSAGAPFSEVTEFVVAADGRHVVYRQDAQADGARELYSVRLPAGAPVRLSGIIPSGSWVDLPAITPDGTRVVFRADQDTAGIFEVYSVPIEGPAAAAVKLNPVLVGGGDVDYLRLSPDGARVVYEADQRTNDVFELFSVPVTGPAAAAVRISGSLVAGGDVSDHWISGDGSRVLYRADQQTDEVRELYSVPIAGPPASAVRLNPPLVAGGDVVGPYFTSPDDTRAVYRADQETDGVPELFSVPIAGPAAAGVKLNRDLAPPQQVVRFRIAPDSARVVYLADEEAMGRIEIYSVGIAGGAVTNLNPALVAAGDVLDLQISPDGSRVVFQADQITDEQIELFSVPIAGPSSAAVRISGTLPAGGDVVDLGYKISPDGQWVVYLADQELDGWTTGYRTPLAGPGGGDELLWYSALATDRLDFQIFADSSGVVVRGQQAWVDGIQRLWTHPLAGAPDPAGRDWLGGQLQPNGDCLRSPFPQLLPGDRGALYVADQQIDEQFDLHVLYFRLWGDDFEVGSTARWSATAP